MQRFCSRRSIGVWRSRISRSAGVPEIGVKPESTTRHLNDDHFLVRGGFGAEFDTKADTAFISFNASTQGEYPTVWV
jgi:hypothetical protein